MNFCSAWHTNIISVVVHCHDVREEAFAATQRPFGTCVLYWRWASESIQGQDGTISQSVQAVTHPSPSALSQTGSDLLSAVPFAKSLHRSFILSRLNYTSDDEWLHPKHITLQRELDILSWTTHSTDYFEMPMGLAIVIPMHISNCNRHWQYANTY